MIILVSTVKFNLIIIHRSEYTNNRDRRCIRKQIYTASTFRRFQFASIRIGKLFRSTSTVKYFFDNLLFRLTGTSQFGYDGCSLSSEVRFIPKRIQFRRNNTLLTGTSARVSSLPRCRNSKAIQNNL